MMERRDSGAFFGISIIIPHRQTGRDTLGEKLLRGSVAVLCRGLVCPNFFQPRVIVPGSSSVSSLWLVVRWRLNEPPSEGTATSTSELNNPATSNEDVCEEERKSVSQSSLGRIECGCLLVNESMNSCGRRAKTKTPTGE